MPGVPRYPKDMGTEWMQLKRDVHDAQTSANTRRVPFTKMRGFFEVTDGGLKIYNSDDELVIQVGELPNGNNGIAALNPAGTELVELNTLALGLQVDTVFDFESTSSSSMTNLATHGPSVTVEIGTAGRCILTLGAQFTYTVPAGSAISTAGGMMGFERTGPDGTFPGADYLMDKYRYDMVSGTGPADIDREISASKEVVLEGLVPGTHTFTAKYARITNGSANFGQRNIKVQPY